MPTARILSAAGLTSGPMVSMRLRAFNAVSTLAFGFMGSLVGWLASRAIAEREAERRNAT